MAYELNKSDGTILVELSDGLVDSTHATIKFVGKNVVNYGEIQNENFLGLLEHFAKNAAPSSPLAGQVWYDTAESALKMYDVNNQWHQLPKVAFGTTATNHVSGDFWYDTTNNQLKILVGTDHISVGPNSGATYLANPKTINGVTFDGTQNITISSTITNSLSAGSYLSGDAFNGSSAKTWTVDVGTVNQATGNKVVARDSAGDIWYTVGHGDSATARYADIAEKYLADAEYETGTVVTIGGTKEIRACQYGDRAIGVVSANPAYLMNIDLVGGTAVALKGRVPVKIIGEVLKGDKLVAASNGHAEKAHLGHLNTFAIALADSNGSSVVEALIL